MTTYHGKYGTKQDCNHKQRITVSGRAIVQYRKSKARRIVDSVTYAITWNCNPQTTLPDHAAELPRRKLKTRPAVSPETPEEPQETPETETRQITWQGEHPLNGKLLEIVSRIDWFATDEDMAQDMLLSLLQRSHTVKNSGQWRSAVRYAILDARRKRATMRETAEPLETDPGKDNRRHQLPGPMKSYQGPEPPLPIKPQAEIQRRVKASDGRFRFNREFQVAAYVMPE